MCLRPQNKARLCTAMPMIQAANVPVFRYERMDFECSHEGLRRQILCILVVASMRHVITIDARDTPAVELRKRLHIGARLQGKLTIIHGRTLRS